MSNTIQVLFSQTLQNDWRQQPNESSQICYFYISKEKKNVTVLSAVKQVERTLMFLFVDAF